MAIDKINMIISDNYINYNGKRYPCRWVTAPLFKDEYQESYLIATESLRHVLLLDSDIPTSKQAEMIDNQVFFYVCDNEINLNEDILKDLLIQKVV